MTDVNTEGAPSAPEPVVVEPVTDPAPSAGTQNTETPGPVPYERFKEINDQKNSLESEAEELRTRNEGLLQRVQSIPQTSHAPQPMTQQEHDAMVEQFGYEGAQAIRSDIEKKVLQPLVQQQFAAAYKQQYEVGKAKFGDDWSKYDYKDPITGQVQGNKVLDLMAQSPALDLESAWNATNPVDRAKIEQEMKDKIYAEIGNKDKNTPASAPNSAPSTSGNGHAMSVAEAFAQAEAELAGG